MKTKVSEGGHNIEKEIIARRYLREINNLFEIYLPIIDGAYIFDNSEGKQILIAYKTSDQVLTIENESKFEQSIMLEINRALYLNEPGNEKSEKFLEIKKITREFIKLIKSSL